MSSSVSRKLTKKSTIQLVVVLLLALLVAASALPRYASSWPWSTPLKVANQSALQAIRDEGINLAGWTVEDQVKTKIGGDTWSIQQLSEAVPPSDRDASTVFLLLRPQVWEADQPEVEWLDVKGSQRWQTDSRQNLALDLPVDSEGNAKNIRINTDFFRAWSNEQTYAVLQWYAWPTGGDPSPAWWFWADQTMQWRERQRMPWVAISLWLPIQSSSDINARVADAEILGKAIHSTLLETVFDRS